MIEPTTTDELAGRALFVSGFVWLLVSVSGVHDLLTHDASDPCRVSGSMGAVTLTLLLATAAISLIGGHRLARRL